METFHNGTAIFSGIWKSLTDRICDVTGRQ